MEYVKGMRVRPSAYFREVFPNGRHDRGGVVSRRPQHQGLIPVRWDGTLNTRMYAAAMIEPTDGPQREGRPDPWQGAASTEQLDDMLEERGRTRDELKAEGQL